MNRKALLAALSVIVLFAVGCNHHKKLGPITVTLSGEPTAVPPAVPTLQTGQQVTNLAATVANDPTNSGVIWSCTPVGTCGTFSSNSSQSGVPVTYTAPGIPQLNVVITATSAEDSAVSASTPAPPSAITIANGTNFIVGSYTFYVAGTESSGNQYTLAGVFTVADDGTVTGEQDFNDGTVTTALGAGDAFDAAPATSLSLDPTTGLGTLIVSTTGTGAAIAGETLSIQFVNPNHALIIQFDGNATSSGSLDLQTATSLPAGNFSFTMAGLDSTSVPVEVGGVFTFAPGSLTGTIDVNDGGGVALGTAGTANLNATTTTEDSFGRGTISITAGPAPAAMTDIVYYVVGPEVIRMVDADFENVDYAAGSAFGQAAGGFTNASIVNSVLSVSGTGMSIPEVLLGQVTATANAAPDTTGGTITGFADVDEVDLLVPFSATASPITAGNYTLATNGYGRITGIVGAGDYTTLGIYAVDPALNINDPNNTATDLGGALVADMDTVVIGVGVLVPQTDASTAATDFTGTYTFGAQLLNSSFEEADFTGSGTVTATSLAFAGTGSLNDPSGLFAPAGQDQTVTFAGTFVPDAVNTGVGRYDMNPFNVTVTATAVPLTVAAYQASGTQIFWMENDPTSTFSGQIQATVALPQTFAVKRVTPKKAH